MDINPAHAAHGLSERDREGLSASLGGRQRLLSISVQLSNSETYEGGQLEVGGAEVSSGMGDAVVFRSFEFHQVLSQQSSTRMNCSSGALVTECSKCKDLCAVEAVVALRIDLTKYCGHVGYTHG